MHYYQFNIGDYTSHTKHLSLVEDAIYRRLLDLYYLHERPLDDCLTTVARLINARGHEKKVAAILKEFFSPTEGGGWVSERAKQEIERYHHKIEAASRAGKVSAQRRLNDRSTDVQLTNNQEPLTINQEPVVIKEPKGSLSEALLPPCQHQKVIDLFHEVLPELPRVLIWNKTREGLLKSRWRERAAQDKWKTVDEGLEFFRSYFDYVRKSKFLMGKVTGSGKRPFECELEWLIRPNNWVKVLEGKYHGS